MHSDNALVVKSIVKLIQAAQSTYFIPTISDKSIYPISLIQITIQNIYKKNLHGEKRKKYDEIMIVSN